MSFNLEFIYMSNLVEKILINRGYATEAEREAFLSPDYEGLHDPLMLADMDKAAERILSGIESGEKMAIYGDYDIDGLSATALLIDGLSAMGADVKSYIPDRFEEGYGINTQALKTLKKQGVGLVITVDCGSVSFEPLEWASSAGLDVIVTDHHEPMAKLPSAFAIINPKRQDSHYPFADLAGVGVAFKLIQGLQTVALSKETDVGKRLPAGQEKWLLDLVALGTVCDVVSLTDENRILVFYGLQVFRRTRRVGLAQLAHVSGLELDGIDAHHFGFVLDPRLNAAGRLEHAQKALDLFIATNKNQALTLASYLDELNTERRRQQNEIYEMALLQAREQQNSPVLVLSHPEWSHGIVGIVAAKILERFHKPTIVMQEIDGRAKGSARSLGGFSMVEALRAADDLLDKYGGHHVAAGCQLSSDQISEFRDRLNAYYYEQGYGDLRENPKPDLELDDFSVLNESECLELEGLAPFGMGNPRPILYKRNAVLKQVKTVGDGGAHLKAEIGDGRRKLDAIGFGMGHQLDGLSQEVDVWFDIEMNHYMGRSNVQLKLKAIE